MLYKNRSSGVTTILELYFALAFLVLGVTVILGHDQMSSENKSEKVLFPQLQRGAQLLFDHSQTQKSLFTVLFTMLYTATPQYAPIYADETRNLLKRYSSIVEQTLYSREIPALSELLENSYFELTEFGANGERLKVRRNGFQALLDFKNLAFQTLNNLGNPTSKSLSENLQQLTLNFPVYFREIHDKIKMIPLNNQNLKTISTILTILFALQFLFFLGFFPLYSKIQHVKNGIIYLFTTLSIETVNQQQFLYKDLYDTFQYQGLETKTEQQKFNARQRQSLRAPLALQQKKDDKKKLHSLKSSYQLTLGKRKNISNVNKIPHFQFKYVVFFLVLFSLLGIYPLLNYFFTKEMQKVYSENGK